MATIIEKKNKAGTLISYKIMVCVGRDEQNKQVWRTTTLARPDGLTPAKERKEIERQADAWEQEQKAEYERTHSKEDKSKITFADFVHNRWWTDHVMDGTHTPSSISFYKYMSEDLVAYFGKKKLNSIDAEAVKRYIKYLNNEATSEVYDYPIVSNVCANKDSTGAMILTWPKHKDAIIYKVTRNRGKSSRYVYKTIGETTELSFTDTDATDSSKYIIKAKVKGKGEPLAPTTIQHHFGTLRNIMQYARRFHYIQFDPCQDLSQKEKPHRGKKKIDFLEPTDAIRFLKAIEFDSKKARERYEASTKLVKNTKSAKKEQRRALGAYRESLYWECLLNVLITTGLRRGECVGLQWGDLDGEKLTLSISRNVSVDRNAPEKYHIGDTKTGEDRVVPISLRLYGLLMSFKREQEAKLSGSLMPSAFMFCSETNAYAPLYPTTVTRHVSEFIKRHNLPNVSPHDLRHTAATLALESGADLKQVQELLGHKDASTTMQFYAGVTDEAKRRTVEGIESLIVSK